MLIESTSSQPSLLPPANLVRIQVSNWPCYCAGQESDADSGEPELCFNPVSLGKAVDMLPAYLQYEIKFGASQRQTLVGRIMEALGKCKVHRDLQG